MLCIADMDMALTDVEAPAAPELLEAAGKNIGMVSAKMSGDGVALLLLLLVVRFSRWVGEVLTVRLLLFLTSVGGEAEPPTLPSISMSQGSVTWDLS